MFHVVGVALSSSPHARAPDEVRWQIELNFHTSAQIAGASEQRAGYGLGATVSRNARMLRVPGTLAIESREMVWLRAFHSVPQENRSLPFSAVWVAAGGHWIGRGHLMTNTFLEAGFGLFFSNDTTYDLSSKVNFGTFIGGGFYLGGKKDAPRFALRFAHVSNAGLRRPNYGINLVEYSFGMKI